MLHDVQQEPAARCSRLASDGRPVCLRQRGAKQSEATMLSPDDGAARVHRDVEGDDR